MRSLESYSTAAVERAMQAQEVILQAMTKKITWYQERKRLNKNGRVTAVILLPSLDNGLLDALAVC